MRKTYLDKIGLSYLWSKLKEAFALKDHTHEAMEATIASLQLTIQSLTERIVALENSSTAQQGIGHWIIGSTFVIGGRNVADGIGQMAIGTTFRVA